MSVLLILISIAQLVGIVVLVITARTTHHMVDGQRTRTDETIRLLRSALLTQGLDDPEHPTDNA